MVLEAKCHRTLEALDGNRTWAATQAHRAQGTAGLAWEQHKGKG